jgi:hypothetical protein
MRMKFLRWLRHRVWKVEEGCMAPRSLIVIYYILFPLNWLYEKRANVRYNAWYNTYTLHGIEFSAEFFRMLADKRNNGRIIKIETDGKYCTFTRL